ncbi:9315_t:CDS:2, partial [Gigaspora rosea]
MSLSNNFTSTHEINTSNYSNNITEDNIQRYINKSKSKILTPVHKNWFEVYKNINKPFRIPFKNVHQHIEMTEDQTQDIETTKNRIPFKNIQDRAQNIKTKKNGTTNIFNFHNSEN